jgi:hypothetical protein
MLREMPSEYENLFGFFDDLVEMLERRFPMLFKEVVELTSWAMHFNLDSTWMMQTALESLDDWAHYLGEPKTLNWVQYCKYPLNIPACSSIRFKCSVDEIWHPANSSFHDFEEIIRTRIAEELQNFRVDAIAKLESAGWRTYPSGGSMQHYRWLALYQVRKLTLAQIAASERGLDEDLVQHAIREKASLIDLPLREPSKKGRKRNAIASAFTRRQRRPSTLPR